MRRESVHKAQADILRAALQRVIPERRVCRGIGLGIVHEGISADQIVPFIDSRCDLDVEFVGVE